MVEISHGWVDLEGGGDKIERGGGDELQSGSDENEIQGFDLCLALMTSFSNNKNEMKVWVGSDEGWVDGGGSMRTRIRDGSVKEEDKGWVSGMACM